MNKKCVFGICGAFDFQEKGTGGQSIKTREFYYALSDTINGSNIRILESTSYKHNPIVFFFQFLALIKASEHIIIFPAEKGIRIFAPICALFAPLFHTKVHYSVIGAWLPKLTLNRSLLKKALQKFDSILVETSTLKNELSKQGINNVHILRNFKRLTPVPEIKSNDKPVRICYFSRVTKLKGIEDAIKVVNRINQDEIKCIFDIYGPVTPDYSAEFSKQKKEFRDYISYKGTINPKHSIGILHQYDIQLFPTRYETEGIPGSIIDSFFAGTPVVSAQWNSFSDVIEDGVTGIGFKQGDTEDFYDKLNMLLSNRELLLELKRNCILEAEKYSPEKAINQFLSIINQ